ncbi:hypothetical protein [Chryseosolibacter indicus]|uniref:Uncharacterized protein n=1 Tax=Chryseosolibacter indicus TaxID=2782351 RepID=A0ABS5VJS1_9BACT|nr:hypothetical protein [Chryseosolibacter indicus]MBT1701685.1 hypothetical protein [Chryseosolibacter indicus]
MELNSESSLSYVTSTEEILKVLTQSLENGNVIGINALSIGPSMVMTAVEDIIDIKNDKIVVLKETDLLGIRIPEPEILLSEIVKVHLMRTLYDDPFHVQLREHKRDNA